MAISEADIQRQVNQMIAFIDQEATEKAEEIDLKADEEYNVEKTRLIQEQRSQIIDFYEKKRQHNEMMRKINISQMHNQARMRILQDREEHMERVRKVTLEKLVKLAGDRERYKKILEGLVTQGLFQLTEDVVVIRCRKVDLELVKSVLPTCIENYHKMTHKTVKAAVDQETFLRPDISGGVELLSQRGKLKVENTIESRLNMMYHQMLPELRDILFGPNQNRKYFD